MSEPTMYAQLAPRQLTILKAVRQNAEALLDCSPRFRFFTLHGTAHIANLFAILDHLVRGGIKLSSDEAYLLSLAICVHDIRATLSIHD